MQVIPAVDVLDGRVVRLTRGEYETVQVYAQDPVATAQDWVSQGAELVHVVDLHGAKSGRASPRLWAAMAGAGIPFEVGGGLRDRETVAAALEAGARRVVLGTATVWRPELLAELTAELEVERLVAALDLREGRAHGRGWIDKGRPVDEVLEGVRAAGIPRVLVTAITRDGTMEGPDLEIVAGVRKVIPGLALMAAGGMGSLDHLRSLAALGVEAAVVGRALYEGVFTLEEARQAAA